MVQGVLFVGEDLNPEPQKVSAAAAFGLKKQVAASSGTEGSRFRGCLGFRSQEREGFEPP